MKKIKSELKEKTISFYVLDDIIFFLRKNGFLKDEEMKKIFCTLVSDECVNGEFVSFDIDLTLNKLKEEKISFDLFKISEKESKNLIKTLLFLKEYLNKSVIQVDYSW
jgi:predicted nucleic-acid-binding protein